MSSFRLVDLSSLLCISQVNGQRLVYKFVNLPHGYKPVKKLGSARIRQLATNHDDVKKRDSVANRDTAPPTMATKTSVIKSVSDVINTPTSREMSPSAREISPPAREISPSAREMSPSRKSPVSTMPLYEPISTIGEGYANTQPVYLQPMTSLSGTSKLCACHPYTFLQPIARALGTDAVTRQTFTVLQTPCCGKVALTPLSGHPVILGGAAGTIAAPSVVQVASPEGRAQIIEA